MSTLCVFCTERADIVGLTSEPFHPIANSSTGCLLAGDRVEIVCAHISYPVATVYFRKDGFDVVLDNR